MDAGHFSGLNNQTILFNGITATETEYNYEFVDWHYHDTPHFALTIHGDFREGTRKETYEGSSDSLLFHNWQEPHYNVKPAGITRGFQLELSHNWCQKFELDLDKLPLSANITNPNVKLLFYNIFKEAKRPDDSSNLTIDALLLQTFASLREVETVKHSTTPRWVKQIDEILHERYEQPISLQNLADELHLHWAHLSRDFPRYFHCNFSQYLRKIKVEKSLALLRKRELSLAEIALACGFSDQSHFTRCCKEFTGITPKAFRKLSQ